MKHVLTVDLGTTSAKLMLVAENGQVLSSKQSFYPTHFPRPGWCEQDPTQVLNSLNELMVECSVGHANEIETVAMSCAMHSVLAVDSKGTALSPAILWSDMRSSAIARHVKTSEGASELYTETGTPIHPMSPLCKLLWLKENDPGIFKSAHRFVSLKEFVTWHWCGKWTVDYSIASATGLFNVHNLQWSTKAMNLVGLSTDRLSEPARPSARIPINDTAATALGLKKGTTVTLGASDGCLANLGSGATGVGDLAITIGTSGAVRMISDKASDDQAGRLFNYRLDENKFVTGGATNNGTIVIDWFAKNFLKREKLSLQEFATPTLNVPPGSGGLLFLPFVFGERAPYHNPDLRGMFFGLAQHHSMDHMMRSVLEGICFEIRSLVEAVEQTVRPVDTILASGGFVRSPDWVQMLANILGREVVVRDVNDASSLGAAIVGFESIGVNARFDTQEKERHFVPEPGLRGSYDSVFHLFGRIAGKLDDEFSEIASMQTHPHVSYIKRNT